MSKTRRNFLVVTICLHGPGKCEVEVRGVMLSDPMIGNALINGGSGLSQLFLTIA